MIRLFWMIVSLLVGLHAVVPYCVAQGLDELAAKPSASSSCDCDAPKKDPEAWDLSAAFGFNYTQGNVSSNLLTGAFNAEREKDKDIYKFNVSGAEGEQDDETIQRFFRTIASYDHLVSKRTFLGVNFSFLSDEIADVDYRTIISPQGGVYLVKNEDLKFSISSGPAYVFQQQGGDKDNFLAWRVSDDFSWDFSETANIFQTAEFLLNTENANDSLLITRAGVKAALNSLLSLVLQIEDRFDNLPAEGRKRNDVIVTSALQFSF